jgi:hypothetical protein
VLADSNSLGRIRSDRNTCGLGHIR